MTKLWSVLYLAVGSAGKSGARLERESACLPLIINCGWYGGAAYPFLYKFVTEIRPQNITLVYFLRLTSLCSSLVTEFFEISLFLLSYRGQVPPRVL